MWVDVGSTAVHCEHIVEGGASWRFGLIHEQHMRF